MISFIVILDTFLDTNTRCNLFPEATNDMLVSSFVCLVLHLCSLLSCKPAEEAPRIEGIVEQLLGRRGRLRLANLHVVLLVRFMMPECVLELVCEPSRVCLAILSAHGSLCARPWRVAP